jgi:hypothetical protein
VGGDPQKRRLLGWLYGLLEVIRNPLRVNFGKGRMKKIVEEEDAQHVDAMQYAATAGIRVEQENLKPIETRVGFWPTVFECEK